MHLWINALTHLSEKTIEDIGDHAVHTDATASSFWDKVLTMVTTYGVRHNAYWNDIQSEITMKDLFSR